MAEAITGEVLQAPEELYRLRVVRCYVEEGQAAVEGGFKLQPADIRAMQAEPWWAECVRQVLNGQSEELDRRFTKMIALALDKADARLRNGDEVVDKFGDTHYVPIRGKDAATMAALLIDKQQVLRGLPSSIVRNDINLDAVAEKLRRIVRQDPATRAAASPADLEAAVLEQLQ